LLCADRRDKEEELRAVICFLFTDEQLRWDELPQLYFHCVAFLNAVASIASPFPTPWYFATRLNPVDSADYRLNLYALMIDLQFHIPVNGMNQITNPKIDSVRPPGGNRGGPRGSEQPVAGRRGACAPYPM
jgi:hypothetical protein